MKCIHLILGVFVLTGSLIECRAQSYEADEHHLDIIVNAINSFRDDLMCVKPVVNMDYISKWKEGTVPGLQITPKMCDYTRDGQFNLTVNVQNFISKCIKEASWTYSAHLDWMWNDEITNIDCEFSPNDQIFVRCRLNKIDGETHPEFQKINKANQMNLYTNLCNDTKLRNNHHHIKSCFLRQQSRNLIIEELNKKRNKELALARSYTNLQYVEWDFDLEIAAIELSQFDHSNSRFRHCFFTKKFGHASDMWYYENHTMIMPTESFIIYLIPNLLESIMPNILTENEYHPYLPYPWMYDAKLRAIGCTFFKLSKVVHVLCVFNRDPEGKFNLQKGERFCSKCECRNSLYPYLCTASRVGQYRIQVIAKICVYILIVVVYFNIITISIYLRTLLKCIHRPIMARQDLYVGHEYNYIEYNQSQNLGGVAQID